jgi:hypothetical protein
MTDRIPPIFLVGPTQRQYAHKCIDAAQPDEVCIIKKAKRREIQSEKFHAMCGDVARQCQFLHRTLTKDQWKVIFISGHAIATGLGADMIPGLEGEFVNIRESSAEMSISRMASLIEYVLAYGSEQGVKWTEPNRPGDEEVMNRRYA